MIANTLPRSLQDNPMLDRWIALLPGGGVRLSVGKVELGQGVVTALAQIAAEELDVRLERLVVVAGDTDAAPDEGTTAGSMSIEISGGSVRLVSAETRALLLGQAAAELGCAPAELAVEDGAILRNGTRTGQDYWTLGPRVSLARPVTGMAPVKPRGAYGIVGTPAHRLDLPAKLRGGGFVQDFAPPGLRHALVLRQPRPGAMLVSLDEAAMRRRGARQIIRRGNFVAVLADSAGDARRAAAAANPVWSGGAALPAAAQEAQWLMEQPATELLLGSPPVQATGPVHAATYSRPYLSHGSIGPSCAVAELRDGRLSVLSHTQNVYPLRAMLAEITGLDMSAIVIRHVPGAGCYGHNGADDVVVDAALVALEVPGEPVRVQWRREDEFGFAPVGTAMVVRVAAMLDAAGGVSDWTTEIWSATHGVRAVAAMTPARRTLPDPPAAPVAVEGSQEGGGAATRNAFPLYDMPAQRVRLHLVQKPPVRCSSLRGLGAQPNVFAIECFLDELAEKAGIDPVSYRLAMQPDARARRVIEAAAEMAAWDRRDAGGAGSGKGIAFARYKNRAAYAAVVAEVEVEHEVRLHRVWCACDAGLVINPDGVRNQLEGGIIMAASWTLKEAVRFDADGIASVTWEDYPILRFSEVPEIDCALMPADDEPSLGVGECTMGPTTAAIANAVAHALGVRLRDLPLTRERIMAALLGEGGL